MKIRFLLLFLLTTAGSVLPQTADEYYLEAYKAFQTGDVPKQIMYAEKTISLFEKLNI